MYQFYPKIGTINEKVNTILISPKTLTSYFDVALNKRNAGQGSVFYVWSFLCNHLISLAVRKRFLRLNLIYRLKSNIQRICGGYRQHKEEQCQYSSNFG